MPAEVHEILGKPLLTHYNEEFKREQKGEAIHSCNGCGELLNLEEEFVLVMDRPSGFSIGKQMLFEVAYLYCRLYERECEK